MSKMAKIKSVPFHIGDFFRINLCNLVRNLNNLRSLQFLDFLLITTWIIRLIWLMKVLDSHLQALEESEVWSKISNS